MTGHDVTAWIEVPFQGIGWIPFLPTPTQTDVPQDQVPQPQTEPQPQVRQPPRSQNDENDLVTDVQIDNTDKKNDEAFVLPGWLIGTGLGLGIPALLIFVPLLIVALVKRRRAVRRRTAERPQDAAAGAWDELLDRLGELGVATPTTSTTRPRMAEALDLHLAGASFAPLVALARRTDGAVFSGQEPSGSEVDAVWTEVGAVVDSARGGLPWRKRTMARYRLAAATRWARRLTALGSAPSSVPRASRPGSQRTSRE